MPGGGHSHVKVISDLGLYAYLVMNGLAEVDQRTGPGGRYLLSYLDPDGRTAELAASYPGSREHTHDQLTRLYRRRIHEYERSRRRARKADSAAAQGGEACR